MGIPLPVKLAIAAKRQNKRDVAARRRAERFKEEYSKERGASEEIVSYKPHYDYIDYVVYAIRTNPKLTEFFKKLEDKIQDIRTKEGYAIRAKADELANLAEKYEEASKKIEEELSKEGVTLGRSESVFCDLRSVDARYVGYALNEPKNNSQLKEYHRCVEFNGAELTKHDVEESMEKSYEKEIEELEKSISIDVTERDKISKKLQRLERKRAIYLFQPDKSGFKQAKLRERIEELEKTISKNDKTKHKYEVLSSFTPEQKQKIVKYMKAYDCIKKANESISSLSAEYYYAISPIFKEENIFMAMQMLRDDGMPEEEFLTVKQEFSDIKTGKKKYNNDCIETSTLRCLAESFIKVTNNDGTQEERKNNTLVHEKTNDEKVFMK